MIRNDKRERELLLAILLSLSALSCTPDFTAASVVEELRVLAVRADPAAAAPGEDVTLSTLVADPRGGGRELLYAWEACLDDDPEAEIPVLTDIDCARAEDLPPLGSEPTLTYRIPEEIADIEQLRLFIDQSGTLGIPVRLRVWPTDSPEEHKTTIVPVSVQLEGTANTNPVLDGLLKAGEPWPEDEPLVLRLDQAVTLAATWPASNEESYTVVTAGTGEVLDRQEIMAVSWFASAGKLADGTSSADEPDVEIELELEQLPPEGTRLRVWAILSDGRGGFDWAVRDIETR